MRKRANQARWKYGTIKDALKWWSVNANVRRKWGWIGWKGMMMMNFIETREALGLREPI